MVKRREAIAAFSSICEEDSIWIEQYLSEIERLKMPFYIHFDRCSPKTKRTLSAHSLCRGTTNQDDPRTEFDETHKQQVMDLLQNHRNYDWALAWDVDETFARNAPEKIPEAIRVRADCINVKWVNVWNSPDRIRIDGPFGSGHRCKLYDLRDGRRWRFTNRVVNGAKLFRGKDEVAGTESRVHELVWLHWGMMTRELREAHKDRWDRIYGKAVGRNPYGFWNYALNEDEFPPVTEANPYL